MADLEVKRDAARAKVTEVSQSSGEAWKDVQKGAAGGLGRFGQSLS